MKIFVMREATMIEKITEEIIVFSVAGAGTIFACYITYQIGAISGFLDFAGAII